MRGPSSQEAKRPSRDQEVEAKSLVSGHGVSVERTGQTAGASLVTVIRQSARRAHKLLITRRKRKDARREDEAVGIRDMDETSLAAIVAAEDVGHKYVRYAPSLARQVTEQRRIAAEDVGPKYVKYAPSLARQMMKQRRVVDHRQALTTVVRPMRGQ